MGRRPDVLFIIAAGGRKTPATAYNNKIIQELGYYNRAKVDAAIKEMQTPPAIPVK